jgi:protoporphyrinogen/coproporphyrinogen III oxidase
VIVVGGGITGLAAAHRVLEVARERGQPVELTLLEAGPRLGGIVSTTRRDGFVLESGPDSFITDKPWALALCRRLGLEPELVGTNAEMRRSFILRGERLVPVPEGFHLMAPARLWPFLLSPLLSWHGRLRVLCEWLIPPRRGNSDESLASFVERRLGHEALERVAQPMIAGIYGADPYSLSLRATMPRFLEMERLHGGVIRGLLSRQRMAGSQRAPGQPSDRAGSEERAAKPAAGTGGSGGSSGEGISGARYGLFLSFRDGMQTLIDALVARLPVESLRLRAPVQRLSPGPQGGWHVTMGAPKDCAALETLEADAVCLAIPAYQAAALLREVNPRLAVQLEVIGYTCSATLNLAYRREDVRHPLDGFGFVVPRVENRPILGCTFSSVKFSDRVPEGYVLLRAFIDESALELCETEELTTAAHTELERLLGISARPLFADLRRLPRAMPQYEVGHLDRVDALEAAVARHPGLALAGSAYRGIGIPDCVHSGELAAEKLMG